MRKKADPKYRRQKRAEGGDLAFVELNGKRHYLGAYDSDESREEYHKLLAEWRAKKGRPKVKESSITVAEVLARFFEIAREEYTGEDGSVSTELSAYRTAARPLRELYGRTPAVDFGPLALKAVRTKLIESSRRVKKKKRLTNSRKYVNQQVHRIRRIFKVAASEQLIPASVYQNLRTVEGLKRGRGARETKAVEPVDLELVEKTLPFLSSPVAAAVRLQMATAARPDEILTMRPCDIDRSRDVWIYSPQSHKTEHRGQSREIFLGPQAQRIIEPFLLRPADSFLFSPREADEERRAKAHAERKTPLSCGNSPGTNKRRSPRKQPGERYKSDSYRRAILYGCKRAGVERWTPYRLRHSRSTEIRERYDIEAVQVILGHAHVNTSEIYARKKRAAAIKIMREIG